MDALCCALSITHMKTASIRVLCGLLVFTVSGSFSAAETLATGFSPAEELVSREQTMNDIAVFSDDDEAKEERENKKQALKEERERKKAERKAERERKKEERKKRLEEKRNKGGSSSVC